MSRKVMLSLAAAVGVASAVVVVFLVVALVRRGLLLAVEWGELSGALFSLVGATAAVYALVPRRPQTVLPSAPESPELPKWVVDRPAERDAVVSALVDSEARTIGL